MTLTCAITFKSVHCQLEIYNLAQGEQFEIYLGYA